jgi:hypothetical protein
MAFFKRSQVLDTYGDAIPESNSPDDPDFGGFPVLGAEKEAAEHAKHLGRAWTGSTTCSRR